MCLKSNEKIGLNFNNKFIHLLFISIENPYITLHIVWCNVRYSTFRNSSSEDELENLDKKIMDIKTSMYRIKTNGPNGKLFKGPNDDLLL